MLVPLAVYLPASREPIEGWEPLPPHVPAWWDPSAAPPPAVKRPRLPKAPKREPSLFEPKRPAPAEPQPVAWVDALLQSELFAAQMEDAGPQRPRHEQLRAVLHALTLRGDRLTKVALAQAVQVPELRLGGLLASLRRVLNVDGFDVLSVDGGSQTVTIRRDLLATQFGIEV